MRTIMTLVFYSYKFGKSIINVAGFYLKYQKWDGVFATTGGFMQNLCACSDKLAKKFACSLECNDIPKRAMFARYVCACYKCALYEALGTITVSAVSASFIVPAPNLWVSASFAVGIFLASSVYERLNSPTLTHTQSCLTLSFLQLYAWVRHV